MLLTLATTHQPATDLGFLLYKNPSAVQSFDLPFGKAHVFYPEASQESCRVALLLDVDPVRLVRGGAGKGEGALEQYVNDRPYVASSFMSVAIAQIFGSALSGKSRERPELAITAIPLELTIYCVDCAGGEGMLRRVFEPLGYELEIRKYPLDEAFPEWGDSRYHSFTIRAVTTVHDILTHAYVLIPVLDNEKHYWVGEDEVNKLLRHGEGWLASHPDRSFIVERYLQRKRKLTRLALERLTIEDDADPDATDEAHAQEEEAVERPLSLNERRIGSVMSVLKRQSARRVIDLGCGEARLIERLLADQDFSEVVGVDVSYRALEVASSRLRYEQMSDRQRQRIKLIQGSLTYRDKRMSGYDAATCIEVIEHLDPPRLSAFERVIFEFARPKTVVLTTPNVEFNVKFESLPAGRLRHRDHRFEWTRAEFQGWAREVCARHGYSVEFLPIGDEDAECGAPTQMGVFTL
ncbi:MAG: 3' terminal RNA ribose 2'-O-methyltransferase Hen1 [Candidatus Obscuribacterales bacterium]|nr:3' terminal RNA ribose 2'-O-methyltransferase Hen1 [Candidatus Obscuribacterales bacterium]